VRATLYAIISVLETQWVVWWVVQWAV